jgi:hypothetical protein
MAPSTKANVKQKGKEYIYIFFFKYIEIFFSIEMSGSKIDPQ